MKKFVWKWGLLALAITGIGFGLFLMAVDWYEDYQRNLPQRREMERQAFLNQTVRGYFADDDTPKANLQVSSMAYFGGYLYEFQYDQGKLIYRERLGMPGTPVKETALEVTHDQRELLLDIFNLICKQELWNQGDELPPAQVCDGGEVAYQFTVGSHQGKFKVANADPKHLDLFRHKCWKLLELCQPTNK